MIADRRWLPLLALAGGGPHAGLDINGPAATALFGDGQAFTTGHPLFQTLSQAARILVFRRNASAAPLPLLHERFPGRVRHIASPGILERAYDFPGPLWSRLVMETAHALDRPPPPDPGIGLPFCPGAAAATQATAILNRHGCDVLRRPVLLVPFTGMEKKNWPLGKWRELARRLQAAGQAVLALVDPERETPDLPCPVIRETDIPSLAALCTLAAVVVGGDTGLLQLAALCGAPCLMLFGPSDPALWTPPCEVRVLCAAHPCAPCNPATARACLRDCVDMPVETVLDACRAP